MSFGDNQFPTTTTWGNAADRAEPNERVDFIKKTYLHLLGAILAFCGLEALYLNTTLADDMMRRLVAGGNMGLFLAFILFMVVSWVARSWANGSTSMGLQYAGLALYVFAQSLIFVPIMYYAVHFGGPDVLPTAGMITLLLFAALDDIRICLRKRFFVSADWAIRGRRRRNRLDRLLIPIWIQPGNSFHGRGDRVGLRLHSVRHFEHSAPLPDWSACGRVVGAVCLGSTAIHVRAAIGDGNAASINDDLQRIK